MLAIDDHAEENAGFLKGRSYRSWLAARKRAHRVEKMGKAGEAFYYCGLGLSIGRH